MFVYVLGPIDFWDGWLTDRQFKQQLAEEYYSSSSIEDYEKFRDAAFNAAKDVGWEGDVNVGPFVSALPVDGSEGSCPYMVAWKQSNNGTTFVVSPFRLPWLKDYYAE